MLVVGNLDNIYRLVAHLEAGGAQQRGVLVKIEPQGLDVVLFLGREFDDLGFGGFCLGLFHVEGLLEVFDCRNRVGQLQVI